MDRIEGGLLIACIRLPIIHGEIYLSSIPGCLAVLERNQAYLIQGNGLNLQDFISAENAAYAHYFLIVALMKRVAYSFAPKVDGEAAGWRRPVNEK